MRKARILTAAAVLCLAVAAPAAAAVQSHSVASAAAITSPQPLFPRLNGAPQGAAKKKSVHAAICDYPNGSICMNRNGGGHTVGTAVIGWNNDRDDNEDFIGGVLTTWCNHGIVTTTCPFTVGSGLNDRYAGDPIIAILDTTYGQYIGSSGYTSAILGGGYLPVGGALVESTTNGAFLIDVGVSNHWYGVNGTYDQPYWLVSNGRYGSQLYFAGSAVNSWGCSANPGYNCGSL